MTKVAVVTIRNHSEDETPCAVVPMPEYNDNGARTDWIKGLEDFWQKKMLDAYSMVHPRCVNPESNCPVVSVYIVPFYENT